MVRCLLALGLVIACGWPGVSAQAPLPAKKTEASVGLRLLTPPDVLYAQLPNLPRGVGLVVEKIGPESSSPRTGLRRNDIVLSCDGRSVKSAEQLIGIVRASRADRNAPLVVLRGGKELTLTINLATLQNRLANDKRSNARGNVKNGRPPALRVQATAVGKDKLEVTFEYYPTGTGKLKQNRCRGSLTEIEAEVRKLPVPLQDLARVALDRLRSRKNNR